MNECVEVEADSLEEAKKMFEDPKYDDENEWEPGDICLRTEVEYWRLDPDTEGWVEIDD